MVRQASIFFVTVLAMHPSLQASDAGAACDRADLHALIEGLVALPQLGEIYVEDGAADGTITAIPPSYLPPPEVRRILECPTVSGPLLISRLGDTRLSSAECRTLRTGFETAPVPVGHVYLDILLALSSTNLGTVFVEECVDDGLGACVHRQYYFRPDDYETTCGAVEALPAVSQATAAWQVLLDEGALEFTTPDWLIRIAPDGNGGDESPGTGDHGR